MQGIRRKIGRAAPVAVEPGGVERAWRLALARAARDSMSLALDVTDLRLHTVSLADLVERPAERALLAVLDVGGAEGLGLCALEPAVLAGMIAALTTGRATTEGATPRRPTRTDAAMLAPLIDAALTGLADILSETPESAGSDVAWASGWRYASFLEEARPLSLLLDDCDYRLFDSEISLMRGAVTGRILLALPQSARVLRARPDAPAAAKGFTQALQRQVAGATCRIEAELARLSLPLARLMALSPGDVLALDDATLSRLVLKGLDGRPLAEGRLGQMRGQRAVRINATDPVLPAPGPGN